MPEMPKTYNPREVEDKIYKIWEESGFFNPDNLDLPDKAEKFSIAMPPPNATGVLHLGHASMLAYQDLMARYNRMKGRRTLWLPGTDHAAIATQTKVEKIIAKKGKTKYDLGREKFLERVNQFAEDSRHTIKNQTKKMGSSCDWSRERYTLDEGLSRAVREIFAKMYNDGLVYRGDRIVNWCPRCESTLADDEVEHRPQKAKLYYFKYQKDFPITIATTRPETKLGDSAVAVNPKDERYKKYIGRIFEIDLGNGIHNIKIIADREVDMNFGTGALGVTPAHSMADWEMAEKNGLEKIKIIGEDGKMNASAGAEYKGLTVLEAREKFARYLEKNKLIKKIEEVDQSLSACYRCDTPIEPLPSLQWFINVDKKIAIKGNKYFQNKSLKDVAIEVVKNKEIKIIPERFEKTYLHWMENLRDWCISRQIWFGHKIPVWYGKTKKEMKITFIRHCQSEGNAKDIAEGRIDSALTDKGKEQAKEIAKAMDVKMYNVVFCSTLNRAKETAGIIFGKNKIIYDDRLVEIDFGKLTGEKTDKIDKLRETGFSDGERYSDVVDRVRYFLEEAACNYQDKHIVIVSHSGVWKALEHIINGKALNFDLLSKHAPLGPIEYVKKESQISSLKSQTNSISQCDAVQNSKIDITYFVHGITIDNENNKASGHCDAELSELGVKQSRDLKETIKDQKFDIVFCSDLKRAIDSASLVFGDRNIKIIQDKRLRECDYGNLTQADESEVLKTEKNVINDPFPNGESYKDVEDRIKDFLGDLMEKYQGKKIAIVSHKAPQLALDVILKNKTWEQAMNEDWRKTKSWQPGWKYELNTKYNDEIYVGVEPPEGEGWTQDEDTLDTWFSSGLWTFSTLLDQDHAKYKTFEEWIAGSDDLKKYHPTSVMETGYDILFFWVARMILMTTYALGEIPFEKVYLHGMVRDKQGRKMSKSLGNGIDPVEMIEKYGTDALRLSMIIGASPGNDIKLYEEKIEGYRNFVNKLWNISRYIILGSKFKAPMPIGRQENSKLQSKAKNIKIENKNLTYSDKWILGEMGDLIRDVKNDLNNYLFSQAGEKLKEFTWDKLADWYLEISKLEDNGNKKEILFMILEDLLKLWHPFMPFVTEQIWSQLNKKDLLMIEKWPEKDAYTDIIGLNETETHIINKVQSIIIAIRNARAENKIEANKQIEAVIYAGKSYEDIKDQEVLIKGLRTGIEKLDIKKKGEKIENSIPLSAGDMEIYLMMGKIGKEKEIQSIKKEIEKIKKYIITIKNKLDNKRFVDNAPANIVEKEREKLKESEEKLKKLGEKLKSLL